MRAAPWHDNCAAVPDEVVSDAAGAAGKVCRVRTCGLFTYTPAEQAPELVRQRLRVEVAQRLDCNLDVQVIFKITAFRSNVYLLNPAVVHGKNSAARVRRAGRNLHSYVGGSRGQGSGDSVF